MVKSMVNILDVTEKYYTNEDGNLVYNEVVKAFKSKHPVIVSFEGITEINSSFINSAFIQLLDSYDMEYIKDNLTFKNSTRQINQLILSRFDIEDKRKQGLLKF